MKLAAHGILCGDVQAESAVKSFGTLFRPLCKLLEDFVHVKLGYTVLSFVRTTALKPHNLPSAQPVACPDDGMHADM